jgi:hypothetical protein
MERVSWDKYKIATHDFLDLLAEPKIHAAVSDDQDLIVISVRVKRVTAVF